MTHLKIVLVTGRDSSMNQTYTNASKDSTDKGGLLKKEHVFDTDSRIRFK